MDKINIPIIKAVVFGMLVLRAIPSYAGIGAVPGYQELVGAPNAKLKGCYTVYNTGEVPIDVDVYFKDYFKLDANKKIKTKDWLHIRPGKFKLGPKEKKDVKFIAVVPENAAGEVMSLIFFRSPSASGSNVMVSFGVSLYVGIKGTEVIKGEIEDVNVEKALAAAGNVPPYYSINVIVKNSGNLHLRPKIKVVLYKDKEVLKTVDFPFGWPVFPRGSYKYTGSWAEAELKLKPGSYMASVEVSFNEQVLKRKAAFFVDRQGDICMK